MFVFGLIVGIILGAVGGLAVLAVWAMEATNLSFTEMADFGHLMTDAGHNRACTTDLWHDGEVINSVTLPEK